MKKFIIALGGILGLFIVIAIAIPFYFTDAKLREIVLPIAEENLGRPVEIKSLELKILSTFPNVGLAVHGFSIPDDQQEAFVSVQDFQVEIQTIPLLSHSIKIDLLTIENPVIHYLINKKSESNIDRLLAQFSSEEKPDKEESEETESSDWAVQLKAFQLNRAFVLYKDESSDLSAEINNISFRASLELSDKIASDLNLSVGGLSVVSEKNTLVKDLAIQLEQKSEYELSSGDLTISNGKFTIAGLSLDLTGSVGNVIGDSPKLDLQLQTASPDLNALLKLIPDAYADQIKGVETKGSFSVDATINGDLKSGEIPPFKANVSIKDGWFKYLGYEPITDIALGFNANNSTINLTTVQAKAGANTLSVAGNVSDYMSDNILFNLNSQINADLSTLKNYYDLTQFDVDELRGKLAINAKVNGNSIDIEHSNFNAQVDLSGGFLRYRYPGVTKPIENITLKVTANPQKVIIQNFSAKASNNSLNMTGTVDQPLSENKRYLTAQADINVNLETIKDFYPLNPDTVQMKGQLLGKANVKGYLKDPEKMAVNSTIELKNGAIKSKLIPQMISAINVKATANNNKIAISNASFKTLSNSLVLKGEVSNFLNPVPYYSMNLSGTFFFKELTQFTGPIEGLKTIDGTANLNLNLKGKGTDFDLKKITYSGTVGLNRFTVSHDSLPKPIKQINAELTFSDKSVTLKNLGIEAGESKITINGALANYQIFIDETLKGLASLTGNFQAERLNIDEWMDWTANSAKEENTEPILLELPNINAKLTAKAKSILVMGAPMTNFDAALSLNPKQVNLDKLSLDMFSGKVSGALAFKILRPTRSHVDFKGKIANVRAESFLKEYKFTGKNSELHNYLSGGLSMDLTYQSELDSLLSPDFKTSNGKGNFGMTKSRLKNHPVQNSIADLLKANELKNIALDDWKATYDLQKGLLTLSDMKLTSGNIGAELNGKYDLVKDNMDFKMSLYLPNSYSGKIASWISKEAVEALTQKDGNINIPLKLTGSSEKPKVTPDMDEISKMIKNYAGKKIEEKAKDLVKGLFKN